MKKFLSSLMFATVAVVVLPAQAASHAGAAPMMKASAPMMKASEPMMAASAPAKAASAAAAKKK